MVAKDARISRSMNNHTVLYHTTVAYTVIPSMIPGIQYIACFTSYRTSCVKRIITEQTTRTHRDMDLVVFLTRTHYHTMAWPWNEDIISIYGMWSHTVSYRR
jgi:hypothetical protein